MTEDEQRAFNTYYVKRLEMDRIEDAKKVLDESVEDIHLGRIGSASSVLAKAKAILAAMEKKQ